MSNELTVAQPVANEPTSLLAVIARAANDPAVDVAKMEKLLEMQLKISSVQAEAAFNKAMSDCQAEMPMVYKDKKGENNRYATLESVDKVARPIYSKHGFSLSFGGDEIVDGMVTVHCRLSHCEKGASVGHSVNYKLTGQVDTSGPKGGATKTGIQGMGSTASYLRRYLTCMIFNIATTDDNDGAAPDKTITEHQREAIINALGGPGERVAGFCKAAKIDKVDDLLAKHFDTAMAKIAIANANPKA
jgi:hypothetical protein